MINLSIIIVNYKSNDIILGLIKSIKDIIKRIKYEIIIVDNCGHDNQYDCDKYIAPINNIGYGSACNLGARSSKYDYLLFLNPDIIFYNEQLELMCHMLNQSNQIGVLGCQHLNQHKEIAFSNRGFPSLRNEIVELFFLNKVFPKSKICGNAMKTYENMSRSHYTDSISGAFLLIKRDLFWSVGGFDEQYFMYVEETDLCYRLNMMGYKAFYYSDMQILHYEGHTKDSNIFEIINNHISKSQYIKKYNLKNYKLYKVIQVLSKINRVIVYYIIYCLTLNTNYKKKAVDYYKSTVYIFFNNKYYIP